MYCITNCVDMSELVSVDRMSACPPPTKYYYIIRTK